MLFSLSDRQMGKVLANITNLHLMLRGCGEALIAPTAPPRKPLNGEFRLKSGQFSKERKTEECSCNHWVVMAFRLAIVLYFLALFSQGWSRPGSFSESPQRILKRLNSHLIVQRLHVIPIFLMPR